MPTWEACGNTSKYYTWLVRHVDCKRSSIFGLFVGGEEKKVLQN